MRRTFLAAGVAAVCLAGAAGAQDTGSVSAQQAVAARKAAMNLSGGVMAGMKAAIDSNAPVRGQVFASAGLVRWARAMPGVFPAGSGQAELGAAATGAKAEIWSNRADFEARAEAYAAAAMRLNELARADDAAGFAAQWTEVRASCQACHDVYKA